MSKKDFLAKKTVFSKHSKRKKIVIRHTLLKNKLYFCAQELTKTGVLP